MAALVQMGVGTVKGLAAIELVQMIGNMLGARHGELALTQVDLVNIMKHGLAEDGSKVELHDTGEWEITIRYKWCEPGSGAEAKLLKAAVEERLRELEEKGR